MFYIGATFDPDMRLYNCSINKKMNKMFILCTVPNKLETDKLLEMLIGRFEEQKKCINMLKNCYGDPIPTTDDDKEQIQDTINYIYVLFR
jgi:hypothetical protein